MNKTKASASSQLAKQTATSGTSTKRASDASQVSSQAARKRLADLPDKKIDYSDVPHLENDFLKTATHNPYFRPVKQQVTLRLDADVIAWLRRSGKGYQTRLNGILRGEMRRELVASLNVVEDTREANVVKAPGRRVSLSAVSKSTVGARHSRKAS